MLVRENLYKSSKNLYLGAWKTNVTQNGNIVEATKIDDNAIVAYISKFNLSNDLKEGETYTLNLDFQKLMGEEIIVHPAFVVDTKAYVKDGELKNLKFKGIHKSNNSNLDIASQKDKRIKFMVRNLIFSKGEEFPDLWIPAKTDLNKTNLYPHDGEYIEIKAVWKEKKWQRE